MAKERKASVIYEGNASQLVYAFPFDYLRKKFVKVEDIYTNITELTISVDYTVEDKQVRLVKGIPIGHSVKIYRETTTDPLVEWQDASVLRSADLSLQEVQLLHLAEETADKVFDSGMSTAYGNPNCWDGQYKRIINALDPIEDGDVVTLRYIKANQRSLLNALKAEGAKQNDSIVAAGDNQNKRLTTTGDSYVSSMTTLKYATTTKATEASNSAELSKKWAMSDTSPDGVTGNKSSKTWAGEAKTSASNANASASSSQSSANASSASATQSANSASASKSSATASASSASAASSSASAASTSATNAKVSETNAANSAKAAKQSAEDAATFDPSTYYSKTEVDTKISEATTSMIDIFYPIGTVYMSADKSKTKADFPFMVYGTWEEVPANLCLQTGSVSEAGTQRNAGVPNITGELFVIPGTNSIQVFREGSGALSAAVLSITKNADEVYLSNYGNHRAHNVTFDASQSSPVYGSSDTVQPPAYMVRAWVRTA